MIAPKTIDQLLQAAKQSIDTRQAEDVAEGQFAAIFDYLETFRKQLAAKKAGGPRWTTLSKEKGGEM